MTFSPATRAVTHVVTEDDTALALGSGDLPVLATPRLLAWCEEASCATLGLDEGSTSVGTKVELEHVAASAVGSTVTATATEVGRDGRTVQFKIVAHDEDGTVLASGELHRVVVERDRFLARVQAPHVTH